MLRGLRRPHRLETEPLARFLCHAYGIPRPYDACVHTIRHALLDKGLVGKRLYDLIRICDIDAASTIAGTASEMGLSPRQFFRYRREAVVALAAHANALGAERPAPASPVEELAQLLGELDPSAGVRVYEMAGASESTRLQRLEAALNAGIFPDDAVLDAFRGVPRLQALLKTASTAYLYGNERSADAIVDAVRERITDTIVKDREAIEYELEKVRYIRALYREPATRTAHIAAGLVRAARGDEARMIAALAMEAEADLRCGELAQGEQATTAVANLILPRKQIRLLGVLVCLRAALAFMRCDFETAYAEARSASLALPDRRIDAMTLTTFIGRVSIALGLPWRAPRELLDVAETPVRFLTPSRSSRPLPLDGSTRRLFHRLYLESVDLRAAVLAGELASEDSIRDALAVARDAGYLGIEASLLGTLAQWFDGRGSHAEGRRLTMEAWKTVVDYGDAFIAHDLFFPRLAPMREFGAVDLDATFFEAFYAAMGARFGGIALAGGAPDPRKDAFWRAVLLRARGRDGGAIDVPARGCAANQRAAFVRAVVRETSILLPPRERPAFESALRGELELRLTDG